MCIITNDRYVSSGFRNIFFENEFPRLRFHLMTTFCFLVLVCVASIYGFISTTTNMKFDFKCFHTYHMTLSNP
ncbi:hypothetical protein NY2A_b340R [Paramecium bursaria Chlorella virus NY2A]|uniref:Uncharacterized protein b340R n=1 Tax=Paramecium bursaria Chlorella virus NY2A TaxID=46021 RepID=A7IWL5_PBCVN|nr:hypothetical protein NY2A_b340R [Paramecium bursaria Chlorella virus NY2A]ABT14739.1 hypothetical protein NY2A_b340R [Paramecium bursaria Chlorella virus NY2A]